MKTFYKTAMALMAVMTLTLTSCGGDDDNAPVEGGNLPTGSYIKGKVDGAQFENLQMMGVSSAIATRTGTGDQTLILVSGSDMSANTMVITTFGITATGTYTVNAEDDGTVMAYVPGSGSVSFDTSNCSGATGTLTVTALDATKIEGTFQFVGKDDENCSSTKNITEGSFRGVFAN